MSPGNDAGRTRALTARSSAAAAGAVAMVLMTAAVAAQLFVSRPIGGPGPDPTPTIDSIWYPPTSRPVDPSVFEGGQVVFSYWDPDIYFEVPPTRDGWQLTSGTVELEVSDDYVGHPPRVWNPTSFGPSYCKTAPLGGRGYVGFGVLLDSVDVKEANTTVVNSWRDGLASQEEGSPDPVAGPQQVVTLEDGTTSWVSTVTDNWSPAPGSCATRRVAVTVLSLDTPGGVAAMVAFRYLGADVRGDQLAKILRSVRRLPADHVAGQVAAVEARTSGLENLSAG